MQRADGSAPLLAPQQLHHSSFALRRSNATQTKRVKNSPGKNGGTIASALRCRTMQQLSGRAMPEFRE
ncbi:hypothetical protein V9T40_010726 [Parthenolecanium corni]|uniref:Uncharacterized protein n=1 Tax=Parthenolecanium corni TaxID=536013 RepID=A0AAN9XYV3_9HEMI